MKLAHDGSEWSDGRHERRLGKRAPIDIPARIIDGSGRVTPVMIKDISISGVRIDAPPHAVIPEQFTLYFFFDGIHETQAEIAWRSGFDIGVRFLAADETVHAAHTDAAAQVKKISLDDLRKIAARAHG